ncbi:hypothetical protein ACFLS1_07460 [Verrucomicrobiota bacterium]
MDSWLDRWGSIIFIKIPMLLILGWIVFCVIRRFVRASRAKTEIHDKVQKAIADITADGVIEGPKGKLRPRRWGERLRRRQEIDASPRPRETVTTNFTRDDR